MNQTRITQLLSQPAKLVNPEKYDEILKEILEAMECSTGTIHRYDAENKILMLLVQKGIPPQILEKVSCIPLGKGIAGTAAETKDVVHICNLQTDTSGISQPDAKQTEVA